MQIGLIATKRLHSVNPMIGIKETESIVRSPQLLAWSVRGSVSLADNCKQLPSCQREVTRLEIFQEFSLVRYD
jgi:hypothetical protein